MKNKSHAPIRPPSPRMACIPHLLQSLDTFPLQAHLQARKHRSRACGGQKRCKRVRRPYWKEAGADHTELHTPPKRFNFLEWRLFRLYQERSPAYSQEAFRSSHVRVLFTTIVFNVFTTKFCSHFRTPVRESKIARNGVSPSSTPPYCLSTVTGIHA